MFFSNAHLLQWELEHYDVCVSRTLPRRHNYHGWNLGVFIGSSYESGPSWKLMVFTSKAINCHNTSLLGNSFKTVHLHENDIKKVLKTLRSDREIRTNSDRT